MAFSEKRQRREADRNELLKRLSKASVSAEIGVWKGDFSERILEVTCPGEHHLIDPWLFQPEFPNRMYGGRVAKNQQDMDEILDSVRERFCSFPNVFFHRGISSEVLPTFGTGFFDWVYVDGNHQYDYVTQDLELSWDVVKSGGVIAGDDYTWNAAENYPVQRAVLDFVSRRGLTESLEVLNSQYLIRRPY